MSQGTCYSKGGGGGAFCFYPSLWIMSVVDFIYLAFLPVLGLKSLQELDKDSDHGKGL